MANFGKTLVLKSFYLVWLAVGLSSAASCQQQHATATQADSYTPLFTDQQLTERLEKMTRRPKDSLAQFFREWHEAIPPHSPAFINSNDTIRAVYELYRAFYRPLQLTQLGNWEWGNKLNEKAEYVIVGTAISYTCTGKGTLNTDDYGRGNGRNSDPIQTIADFRPPVNVDSSKVLYLAAEYENALNAFLGSKSTGVGERSIMDPSFPAGESEQRYALLRPYIPILHGHWGGYWHLNTHPDVSMIYFNRSLTQAVIDFRVGYQGGIALFHKEGGEWKLDNSGATWIE